MNTDRFKFRVWDKDTHTYNTRNAVALSKSGELLAQSVIGFIHYPDAYSIEQCTGLKDKNGRLIYEGDIVLLDTMRQKIYHSVAWRQGKLVLLNESGDIDGLVWNGGNREVIGNIHETKWGIESDDDKSYKTNKSYGDEGKSEVKE